MAASMEKAKLILKRFSELNQDVLGAAIISNEGLIVVSSLPKDIDEDKIAAIFTALESIAHRAFQQINLGKLDQLIMFGENGGALLWCKKKASLLILMKPDAKLGLMLLDAESIIEEVKEILE